MDRPGEPIIAATRIRLSGTPEAVRTALGTVRETLARGRVLQEHREVAELVLAEVLNNIVEHAYRDQPNGLIDLRLSHSGDHLAVEVADDGRPFPGGRPPCPVFPAPEAMPEGGFGWAMIRRLSEDLAYRREGDRNVLGFRLPAAPDA